MKIELIPVGEVIAGEEGYFLSIKAEYVAAMRELEGFSHLQVFWWCHHNDNQSARKTLTCNTPYKAAPQNMGVFATRSPFRPNPIALTAVMVVDIDHEKGLIKIHTIDALNGTPIIDIKPYHPCCDRIKNVTVPQCFSTLPLWYEDSADFDWDSILNS